MTGFLKNRTLADPINRIALLVRSWVRSKFRVAGNHDMPGVAPEPAVPFARFVELALFALFVPVVGTILFSGDPVGLKSGFAWASALPIVFAARYGTKWGIWCALLAAAACLALSGAYGGYTAALVATSVGTVVMCIVVGDVASGWRIRSSQSDAENNYLRLRLKEFSKDYHVLKVSHGQLEEAMAGQRLSLREALSRCKPVLSASEEGMQAGSELMAVIAQFCSVQIAGLYAMDSAQHVDTTAVATHGAMGDLPIHDPLLHLAIAERKLVSVKLDSQATDNHESGLLAVVPIVDSQDKLHGVLAIRDMHFMAFQQENLNILSLLGGYVGDLLARSRGMGQSQTASFLAELDTAIRFARTHRVESALLCLQFDKGETARAVSNWVGKNIRSLDSAWFPNTWNDVSTAVILLPLLTESDSDAYLHRLSDSVLDTFDLDLAELLLDVQTMQITAQQDRDSCLSFINMNKGTPELLQNKEAAAIARHRIRRVA